MECGLLFYHVHSYNTPRGGVAKWLCSGLQSRVRRFDPDPRLHEIRFYINDSTGYLAGFFLSIEVACAGGLSHDVIATVPCPTLALPATGLPLVLSCTQRLPPRSTIPLLTLSHGPLGFLCVVGEFAMRE